MLILKPHISDLISHLEILRAGMLLVPISLFRDRNYKLPGNLFFLISRFVRMKPFKFFMVKHKKIVFKLTDWPVVELISLT